MSADYAGAIAAIKQRFIDNWQTTGNPTTPYGFVNEAAPTQADGAGNPIPWVLFEIVSIPSYVIGSGMPGQQTVVYPGLIKVHVFAATGTGMGETNGGAFQLALAAGEIFRNKTFYDTVTPGCFVRTGYDRNSPPRIDNGDITSLDGMWFSVTATISFEFWCLA